MNAAPAPAGRPYDPTPDGARLRVRLTPRGGRSGLDRIVQLADGRWTAQVRVAAPPVDGAANAALIVYLSQALAIPKSAILVIAGQSSRLKTLAVAGDPDDIQARLKSWTASAPAA